MRATLPLLALFSLILYSVVFAKTPFHDGIVQEVTITMDQSEFDLFFVNRTQEYIKVGIDFPDKGKHGVGLKIVDTSSVDEFCKHEGCSFKFDFRMKAGKFKSGKTFMGVDDLWFFNNYNDPSLLRYTFAQLFYQDMANARKTGLVNLHINVTNSTVHHLGFYTIMEGLDKYYLSEHWYETRVGDFFEVSDDAGNLIYQGDSLSDYKIRSLTNRNTTGKSMIDFISAINFSTEIEEIGNCTNIDSVLGYIAASSIMGCFKNAVGDGRGVFSFADFETFVDGEREKTKTYSINLIPSDTSDAFGFSNCEIPLSYDEIINKDIMNPLCNESSIENFPLLNHFLQLEDIKQMYFDTLGSMLKYTTREDYIEDFIDYTLYNINDTLIEYAQYNFHTYDEFLCAIERAPDMESCPHSDIPTIQSFIKARKTSVSAQLKAAGWEEPKTNSGTTVAFFFYCALLLLFALL